MATRVMSCSRFSHGFPIGRSGTALVSTVMELATPDLVVFLLPYVRIYALWPLLMNMFWPLGGLILNELTTVVGRADAVPLGQVGTVGTGAHTRATG